MNMAKDFIIPTAILMAICVVAAGALVWVHSFTSPIIAGRGDETKNVVRREVLADADSFTAITPNIMPAGAVEISLANNGAGVVVGTETKGFSAMPVQLMVGIKGDGSIERVAVTNHEETPGIGDWALTEDYLANFAGKTADNYRDVDSVAGATITSAAVKNALASAFNGFTLATGGEVASPPEKGPVDTLMDKYYPGVPAVIAESPEAGAQVLKMGDAGYVITTGARGFGGNLVVAVFFDAEGNILWSVVTETAETPGIGDKVEQDDFAGRFVGLKNAEGVDTIAGSTFSSAAYKKAVDAAAAVLAAVKGV